MGQHWDSGWMTGTGGTLGDRQAQAGRTLETLVGLKSRSDEDEALTRIGRGTVHWLTGLWGARGQPGGDRERGSGLIVWVD